PGVVAVAGHAWPRRGPDRWLERRGGPVRPRVSVPHRAALIAGHRLVAPRSALALFRWRPGTACPALRDGPRDRRRPPARSRGLRDVRAPQGALARHLLDQGRPRVAFAQDRLLDDLTSTSVAGRRAGHPKGQRGCSRDPRPDGTHRG